MPVELAEAGALVCFCESRGVLEQRGVLWCWAPASEHVRGSSSGALNVLDLGSWVEGGAQTCGTFHQGTG